MVNQNILILRPKFNIFWAIFIRLFLTFNTSGYNCTFKINSCLLNIIKKTMPAKDIYHDAVKNALIEDGWTITADPYKIKYKDAE
jgi:hypothetical protein